MSLCPAFHLIAWPEEKAQAGRTIALGRPRTGL